MSAYSKLRTFCTAVSIADRVSLRAKPDFRSLCYNTVCDVRAPVAGIRWVAFCIGFSRRQSESRYDLHYFRQCCILIYIIIYSFARMAPVNITPRLKK